ncbi:CDP-alcohol phosphatidyltransferase family protein [Nocardiopsis sp. CNT312]|uniref:CDP-alcohol phosphatidyltransferase family protein n=1 Tax=Nocardiopsis sp. CNT312 TaxID=1137268 RepID=UPI000492177C|nr:CDP-alcohol phosphatidyltransferase family protein [Nocardiopsis sp. CNT312]
MSRFTLDHVKETYKTRDAWWTVFLVDPLAGRLVVWAANRTSLTPNQLTLGAGLLGLFSAVCFAAPVWAGAAGWAWLLAGALLFHLSFVLDCMDGKIARLKGTGSIFGAWVDFVFDRIRFFGCVMALLVGQWAATGSTAYLIAAPVVVFFDLLRYLNASQVAKTRRALKRALAEMAGEPEPVRAGTEDDPEGEGAEEAPGDPAPAPRGLYARVRASLLRHRVRPHLFSGIEFEMFLCIVAPASALVSLATPLDSLILPIAVLSCAALGFFEAVLVGRLWGESRRVQALLRSGDGR